MISVLLSLGRQYVAESQHGCAFSLLCRFGLLPLSMSHVRKSKPAIRSPDIPHQLVSHRFDSYGCLESGSFWVQPLMWMLVTSENVNSVSFPIQMENVLYKQSNTPILSCIHKGVLLLQSWGFYTEKWQVAAFINFNEYLTVAVLLRAVAWEGGFLLPLMCANTDFPLFSCCCWSLTKFCWCCC